MPPPRLLALLLLVALAPLPPAAPQPAPSGAGAPAAPQEDDWRCLKGVKYGLSDPEQRLASWSFANSSGGAVCEYTGVSCWNMQESRVISLSLSGFGLQGPVPSSLQYCRAATTLDLSDNALKGPIPPTLCDWVPFLVSLDLSGNHLSGPLPAELANCRFLNSLKLSGNSLSGQIPASLARLDRLKSLDLSGNFLDGQIPPQLGASFPKESFSGNSGLCGHPVSSHCGRGLGGTGLGIVIAAGVFGAAASLLLAYFFWRCTGKSKGGRRRHRRGGSESGEDGSWWAERLRAAHNRLAPVSLFQKPIVKVKLADLMAATQDFNTSHIVVAGSSRAGTAYRAVLRDGSALTVKRLHSCPLSEKAFRAEMGRIGQLRHPNIVPLLGFCVVEDERLLVYKHMESGALLSVMKKPGEAPLDWATRLRIAVGAARGLAWLHHGFQVPQIHQNLSSSAVLLDEDYEARITDVGLTRLVRMAPGEGGDTSPFLNGDFGEFGYVAPEYASNPVGTMKTDAYAFGVVLFELVSGQEAAAVVTDAAGEGFKGTLVDWVNQLKASGRISDVVDKPLRGMGHDAQIDEFLKIAFACTHALPRERHSMYRVYHSLKSIGEDCDFSEQFDEFPLAYNKEDSDTM
ncbi:probable inactive receptor kinase At1g27190 [Phragmites australis]|uniref:probable inactive receptor kinase At1g27190 n=1 Tax=Phragmites australis TaxID=29695 RepID=UPI002D76C3B9|nr:probable inactive receptor kinase At1g27190 [Phragmites australis]XP_062184288.1 probable inactive receptor kinase At1g27190 [Phragmites australis]XP_062184289.1 probable inactive receptor kinase At1g27190 [Phragmites australis]